MKGPGCIEAHTIDAHSHERPKKSFCRIDSPSENTQRDKPSIEKIDLTQRHINVSCITN